MPRKCVNSFCYVCGELTLKSQRKPLTPLVKKAYKLYFDREIYNQDKSYAPNICCNSCSRLLTAWLRGSRSSMPFAVPMIWKEQMDHIQDCYFCAVDITGFTKKSKHVLTYPNLRSAARPLPHSEDRLVPTPPLKMTQQNYDFLENESIVSTADDSDDPSFLPSSSTPHLLTPPDLNDLIRDLNLSKAQAELLGSRLQGWNLLAKGTNITSFRTRQEDFKQFFSTNGDIVYCNDVENLMACLGHKYVTAEWRLFIDSSKLSLKAVLLHNGNSYPSVPIGYSVRMKETYENMRTVLNCIGYAKYEWNICGDLKVIGILLGMQQGYTKFSCFLCEWNSRDKENHYIRKDWPRRQNFITGQKNVLHELLVSPQKIYLPPLHIKLGLMKNFVKRLDKNSEAFRHLRSTFPSLSDAKVKEGIFVGPQIRRIQKDMDFEAKLTETERSAWKAFKLVCSNFLGNVKSQNYEEIVSEMLRSYHVMGCNMSLKIHFLHSHLNFFPENLGEVSDEHGERFHQDIANAEKRFQGRWNASMLADYCWLLRRDTSDKEYKRKSLTKKFKL